MTPSPQLTRFAWLSVLAAIVTIGLKASAYLLTGSVGLLSDALESIVNLVAAIVVLIAIHIAAQPPDDEHSYGHTKVEYLSSGVEGTLILFAAGSIVIAASQRLLYPEPIEAVGWGLGVSFIATLINLGVAQVLLRAGRQYESIILEADARHLMTDVWTSVGVIVAIGLVTFTGWTLLDPLIAFAVAVNIIRSGIDLMRRAALGLIDTALPANELERVQQVLEQYRRTGVEFHAILSRQAATRRFVSFHVLVPDHWTVRRGHDLLEQIEHDVRQVLPNTNVFTHLEPLHDPVSWDDTSLDRVESV